MLGSAAPAGRGHCSNSSQWWSLQTGGAAGKIVAVVQRQTAVIDQCEQARRRRGEQCEDAAVTARLNALLTAHAELRSRTRPSPRLPGRRCWTRFGPTTTVAV